MLGYLRQLAGDVLGASCAGVEAELLGHPGVGERIVAHRIEDFAKVALLHPFAELLVVLVLVDDLLDAGGALEGGRRGPRRDHGAIAKLLGESPVRRTVDPYAGPEGGDDQISRDDHFALPLSRPLFRRG